MCKLFIDESSWLALFPPDDITSPNSDALMLEYEVFPTLSYLIDSVWKVCIAEVPLENHRDRFVQKTGLRTSRTWNATRRV